MSFCEGAEGGLSDIRWKVLAPDVDGCGSQHSVKEVASRYLELKVHVRLVYSSMAQFS